MINIALELREGEMVGVDTGVAALKTGRIACPNPDCRGGYTRSRLDARAIRICPCCDGFGYLLTAVENRKRYYAIRNFVSEIELQSHKGRGLSLKATKQSNPDEGENTQDRMDSSSHTDEQMIVNTVCAPSCYRVS